MRTRIRIKRAIRLLSCANGKITRYVIMMVCLVCMASCATEQTSSWQTYCQKYHVNTQNPTEEQENYYLDCYVGSYEEECDMANAK